MKALALLSLAALLASPISGVANSQTEGQKQKIVLGQVGLSFYAVVGGVVQELLDAVKPLPDESQRLILGATARAFYDL